VIFVNRRRVPRLHPRRALGQNFLRDENIARKIVGAVSPGPADVILEIGPGEGVLTKYLVPGARTLVVVEKDERMAMALRATFSGGAIEVRHGDFLTTDMALIHDQHGQRIRIVGNIPYNITSPILFHILDNRGYVRDATLMLQKEVAVRIVAVPPTKEYGILSVFCQLFADVEKLFDVRPAAFYPKPGVTSSLVRLTMRGRPRYALADESFFRRMVRSIFGKRRKTLRNCLRYFMGDIGAELPAGFAEIDLQQRPEQLSIEQLVRLSNRLFTIAGHGE
jgi:16S rRNA (adenine1518-N6/adenine1519-N6)-dimethyltransferase